MGEHRLRQVPPSQRTMHLSLIAVWLGTALVSAIEHRGLSVQVLADAGIHDARWQTFLIWSGLLADRKSTRLNSSHLVISYAVFCLKKKRLSTRNYVRLIAHN